MAWLAETGADPDGLNPLGGAIALGHPLGGSGARMMTTLIHQMRQHGHPLRPADDVRGRRHGQRHHPGAPRRLIHPCVHAGGPQRTAGHGPRHLTVSGAVVVPAVVDGRVVAGQGGYGGRAATVPRPADMSTRPQLCAQLGTDSHRCSYAGGRCRHTRPTADICAGQSGAGRSRPSTSRGQPWGRSAMSTCGRRPSAGCAQPSARPGPASGPRPADRGRRGPRPGGTRAVDRRCAQRQRIDMTSPATIAPKPIAKFHAAERHHERDLVAGDVVDDDPQQADQHQRRPSPARTSGGWAARRGPGRRPGLQHALGRGVDRLLAHLRLGHRSVLPSGGRVLSPRPELRPA